MVGYSDKKFISWVRQDLNPLEPHTATELHYQLQMTDERTWSSDGMLMYKGGPKY